MMGLVRPVVTHLDPSSGCSVELLFATLSSIVRLPTPCAERKVLDEPDLGTDGLVGQVGVQGLSDHFLYRFSRGSGPLLQGPILGFQYLSLDKDHTTCDTFDAI